MRSSFIVPGGLRSLEWSALAAWANENGFGAIDAETDAPGGGIGIPFGPMRIRASLADSDPDTRIAAVEGAVADLDTAVGLGLSTVWLLPRNFRNDATPAENYAAAVPSLQRLAAEAEQRGVRIAIENCPFEGQNPVCTPEVWDRLFASIDSEALGICMDPSHCVWQGIDYLRAIREYRSRIYHVHAKDTEILAEGLFRYGVDGPVLGAPAGTVSEPGHGWWRHRLPGLGSVDWNGVFGVLDAIGYDGVVSVEHEDPLWDNDPETILRGLAAARAHLARFQPTL